jgi:hypothetical protein
MKGSVWPRVVCNHQSVNRQADLLSAVTQTIGIYGKSPTGYLSALARLRWAVETQAGRIGRLISSKDVQVDRRHEPTDLLTASRNRFLSPLSGEWEERR